MEPLSASWFYFKHLALQEPHKSAQAGAGGTDDNHR
jgi:hypothetical protein